jgi:hypothetical protein
MAFEATAGCGRVNVKVYAVENANIGNLLRALEDADATFAKPEVVVYTPRSSVRTAGASPRD